MKDLIKTISHNKMIGHVLAACIILLALSLVYHIIKGEWADVFSDTIWIVVACLNFKMLNRLASMKDIINTQERFIDLICDAIGKAKIKNGDENTATKEDPEP